MPAERPRVPSSSEQISILSPPESSSDSITLNVSLSDKVGRTLKIKVPRTIFERITGKLGEIDVRPEYVAAGAVVFVAAATAGVVAKKIIEHRRKQSVQEPFIPRLTEEQKQEYENMYKDSHDIIYKFIRNRLRGLDQDVEDLTQEVFKKAYEHFPPHFTHPELPNSYTPWLYTIAGNLVKNRYRDSSRIVQHETEIENEEILLGLEEPMPDMGTIVTSKEEMSELQKAVASLRDPYPLIVWLKVGLQWSNKEIASLIGGTESAVKSTYHRATEGLKRIYFRNSDFESPHEEGIRDDAD